MSDTSPSSTRPRERAGRRILRHLLAHALVWALVLLGATTWMESQWRAAVADAGDFSPLFADFVPPELALDVSNGSDSLEAAALVAFGQKTTDIPFSVPEGEVGIDRIKHVYRQLDTLDRERDPPTEDDVSLFRAAVEEEALALAILDEGLRTARTARYHADYGAPSLEIATPNYFTRLDLASLLRARGEVAVADGRLADAWRDAANVFRVAHWTGTEMPTMVSPMVARAIAEDGALFVQRLLGIAPPEESWISAVKEEAVRSRPVDLFTLALAADRAAFVSSILHPEAARLVAERMAGGGIPERHPNVDLLASWEAWRRWNAAEYLESSTEVLRLCSLSPTERPREFEETFRPSWWAWLALSGKNFISCSVTPHRDTWVAMLDHLAIAVELERIRTEAGGYPDDLTALPESLAGLRDPFDGKAYRYRKTPGGYDLWSVSANAVDDQGAFPGLGPHGHVDLETGDHVWRVDEGSSSAATSGR